MPGRPRGRPRHRRRALPRAAAGRRRAGAPPQRVLRSRARGRDGAARLRPATGSTGSGWTTSCGIIERLGLRLLLPDGRPSRRRRTGDGHPGRRARLGRRLARQPPPGHRARRPRRARAADGALPLRAAGGAARHRHRRGVRPPAGGLPRDLRPLRRGAGRDRRHAGDLPGAARHPGRGRGTGHGPGRDRPDRQGVPAHPGARRARGPGRTARAARRWTPERYGPRCGSWSRRWTRCRAGSPCTRAGCCSRTPRCCARTPVVPTSGEGFPMSQFDKDDVEDLGLLKLDVLGVRMQSAMAHAVAEIERAGGGSDRRWTQVPEGDPRDVRADPVRRDAGLLPDRVAGPAGSGRAGCSRRPSTTSSSTSRSSGRGRSPPTWCGPSSRPGTGGQPVRYPHPGSGGAAA